MKNLLFFPYVVVIFSTICYIKFQVKIIQLNIDWGAGN